MGKTRDEAPTTGELDYRINSVEKRLNTLPKEFNARQHKDETRSKIAFSFTKGYFILLGVALVGVPIYNLLVGGDPAKSLDLRDVLLAVSGITSGPIGFVVGYYFKGSEENVD